IRVGFRSSTIICPKTTLGPPSVGYSRASKPFSARRRRTNAAVSGCALLCAEIVGKRQYSFSVSRAFSASASTRRRTSDRAKPHRSRVSQGGHKNPMRTADARDWAQPNERKGRRSEERRVGKECR